MEVRESIQKSANLNRFASAIWLCPLAFVLHVTEEISGFTSWVQHHINPQFTQAHYLRIHIGGIVSGFIFALLASRWPKRWFIFLYLSLFILPGMLFNILFHLGATIYYREYSPGLITAVVLYPPVVLCVLRQTLNEHLMSKRSLLIALFIAAIFHAAEVSMNVIFFRG